MAADQENPPETPHIVTPSRESDIGPDSPEDEQARRGIRGHVKHWVLVELAKGELTHAAIAAQVGVSRPVVTRYAARNGAFIDRMRQDMGNEMSGLWIAEKAKRVAVYQQQVEDVTSLPVEAQLAEPALVRNAQRALRGVAEELGSLPVRASAPPAEGGTVGYELVGVDMDKV